MGKWSEVVAVWLLGGAIGFGLLGLLARSWVYAVEGWWRVVDTWRRW